MRHQRQEPVISDILRWTYVATADETARVLPDGCRDVLIFADEGAERATLRLTDWDFAPRQVNIRAGTAISGYRLRPGTTIDPDLVIDGSDVTRVEQQLAASTQQDLECTEIIDALCTSDGTIDRLAKQQGVSARTLQRHFKSLSLPTPGFWRVLGRARRAALALPCGASLSDIAVDFGYSDQAHMTREFVRWFGLTPVQLRLCPTTLHDIAQPGLGNWTDQAGSHPLGLQ